MVSVVVVVVILVMVWFQCGIDSEVEVWWISITEGLKVSVSLLQAPDAMKPPPKRRRILDPSAIVPVPVYSSKVNIHPFHTCVPLM